MTVETSKAEMLPRNVGRSIGAVIAGILVVFVLSLGIDEVFHLLDVYPPWNEPMFGMGLNLLALSYRLVIGVLGGYVTARLAPRAPMFHAIVLGGVGTALSLLGLAGAMSMKVGPVWYPLALVVTALPCSWLGGKLFSRR